MNVNSLQLKALIPVLPLTKLGVCKIFEILERAPPGLCRLVRVGAAAHRPLDGCCRRACILTIPAVMAWAAGQLPVRLLDAHLLQNGDAAGLGALAALRQGLPDGSLLGGGAAQALGRVNRGVRLGQQVCVQQRHAHVRRGGDARKQLRVRSLQCPPDVALQVGHAHFTVEVLQERLGGSRLAAGEAPLELADSRDGGV